MEVSNHYYKIQLYNVVQVNTREKTLTDMAEESGGLVSFPDSAEALMAQAEAVSRDIGAQYVLTYRPTRPLALAKPGEYRTVDVASRRVGLYLRSRHGYVVPSNK